MSTSERPVVLFVDDEDALLGLLRLMFSATYEVLTATSVDAALRLVAAKNGHVDALVCDLQMPLRDGRDLLDALGAAYPHLVPRLAFMTGGATSFELQRFIDTSRRPTLDKPLSFDGMGLAVAELVANRRGA